MPRFSSTFSVALCLLLLSGCVTPDRVARRLVASPGTRFMPAEVKGFISKKPFDVLQRDEFSADQQPSILADIHLPRNRVTLQVGGFNPGELQVEMASSVAFDASRPDAAGDPSIESTFTFRASSSSYHRVRRKGVVFLLHGYGGSKEVLFPWTMKLADEGYLTISVDLRGHGQSTGSRIYFGDQEASDMIELLDKLQVRLGIDERIGVFGWSYGAVVGLRWAARDPRVKSVVAIAPYDGPREAVAEFLKLIPVELESGLFNRALNIVESKFGVRWEALETASILDRLSNPALIIRGMNDPLCSRAVAGRLVRSCPIGSRLVEVEVAGHNDVAFFVSDYMDTVFRWFDWQLAGEGQNGLIALDANRGDDLRL